ncbi:hypothetical protein HMN09_01229200 [Mycena chlorophos]|uniref:Uncharacterized protein n=1 Tax=Mycena chlorophos TaxID=658473 RepID=A0A8H6S5J1_MYCCL|nr:hypothetical protein HMN09_01229200 [Mycena chlorophos]
MSFALLVAAFTLLSPTPCWALPIPAAPTAPSTVVALAVCSGVLLSMFALIGVKHIHVHRRMKVGSNLSLPLGSSSALGSDDSASTYKEKSAYFVGFWGSPTVEVQHALEKKPPVQPSAAYTIHTDTRRPRIEYPTVLEINRRLQSEPVQLPAVPEPIHSPASTQRRRLSLPVFSAHRSRESQRRRHSSLKSTKTRATSSPSIDQCATSTTSPRVPSGLENQTISKLGRTLSRPVPSMPATQPAPTVRNMQISRPLALQPKNALLTSPPLYATPAFSAPALTPNLSAFPRPPHCRPKLRVRAQRSPPLGPSPLRTMILPEQEVCDGPVVKERRMSWKAKVGLGVDVGLKQATSPTETSELRADVHNSRASDSHPDALLGIISELLQEANDWPDGAFFSESFKNLLQQSNPPQHNDARRLEDAVSFAASESDDSIRSAEMDPALLGIDFFGCDTLPELSSEGPEDGHETVGLAW